MGAVPDSPPVTARELADSVVGRGMPEDTLAALARRAVRERLAAGVALDRRGDAVLVVLSGRLAVSMPDPTGGALELGEIAAGEVVGETDTPGGAAHGAEVFAREDTELARFDRQTWDAIAAERPECVATITREAQWRERAVDAARSGRRPGGVTRGSPGPRSSMRRGPRSSRPSSTARTGR